MASSLLENITSLLPPHQVPLCEGLLDSSEVLAALKGMSKNKSPGSDGLPAEFYLRFWDVLGSDLTEVLNEAYRSALLSLSQRSGLISLIYKKGDHFSCKNWRPITLLNVDYKLCACTLAGRLLKVCILLLLRIRPPVSLVAISARTFSESNFPLAILSLDQEKAFDCVDWSFLYSTLSKMGFGPSFIRWVQLLYSAIGALFLLTGILLSLSSLLEGFDRVVLCLPYCTF